MATSDGRRRERSEAVKRFYVMNFVGLFLLTQWFLTAVPSFGEEQMRTRAGRWEIFLFGQDMGGDEAHETINGVNFDTIVDDFGAFGLGVGYHVNDYFGINLDVFGGSTDVKIETGLDTLKVDTDVSGIDLNFNAYLFPGPFTPFVTAGIGVLTLYEDYDDHHYHYSYYDDYDYSTSFSYNAGVGVRWDIRNHFFLKALYRSTWSELEDIDETLQFDGFSMFAGYLF